MKFIIEASNILTATQNIKKLVDMGKKYNNILIRVSEDGVEMCYSDGSHSYVEKIEASVSEVGAGKMVVGFDKLTPILQACGTTGALSVHPLEFEVDENWLMTIKVSKYINDGELEGKVVSCMDYKVGVSDPDTNAVQFGVVSRLDSNEMFENDAWDDWNKIDLKALITKMVSDEKDVAIYFSTADKMVKSKNLNYGTLLNAPEIGESSFSIKTSSATAIADIIGKMKGDTVKLGVTEAGFCKIVSGDESVALKFQMQGGNNIIKRAFQTYAEMKVEDIQIKLHRGAFLGALDSIASISSNDKHKMQIVENAEGGYNLRIVAQAAGGSVKTPIDIGIEALRVAKNEDGTDAVVATSYQANILLKSFRNLVAKCEFDWLFINFNMVENRMCKIVDVKKVESTDGVKIVPTASYFITLEAE